VNTNFKNIPKQKSVPSAFTTPPHSKFQEAFALHQRGYLSQAQALYADLLKTQPRHADALHLLGVIAAQSNNPQKAVELIGQAIAIKPDFAEAHCNHGLALQQLMQFDAAVASYDRAIAIKPNFAEAYYNRGIALQQLKRLDAAVASYDKSIAIKPDYAEAHYNRGITLQELKQLDAAVASYDKAIAVKPDYATAYCNRGIAQQELLQLDAAVASYDKAIAIKPDYAEAFCNRGNSLQELLQLDAALASYDKAVAIKPDHAEACWSKSQALLIRGDFEKGWDLHEYRWKRDGFTAPKQDIHQPLWLGVESLESKTILLHSEQGLGDTIQFCRYARLVSDLGARVILEVEESLTDLLNGLTGVSELIVKGAALPSFDCHCPLLSLPLAFKTSLNSIPSSPKYLNADSLKKSQWKDELGEKTMPLVGLVWNGSTAHLRDSKRSVLLSELIQHLPKGCQYVSLQKEVRDIDRLALETNPQIIHFGDQLRDFTDTAALCELMDVVICVDTSVAHLAGALGKSTWVLLPFLPDWRWLLERDDSPWYPTVKLYRQPSTGDWNSVFSNIGADLSHLFGVACEVPGLSAAPLPEVGIP
jgi:tetratricopeptide (TPR) repeat protein